MSPARRPRVVIVGASFAGLAAARRLPATLAVTVVDPSPWFEFLPNIHELLSEVKTPALLRLDRRQLVRRVGHRFVRDAVTAIDLDDRTVTTAGDRTLAYDRLIVAVGGVNATHGVRSADRHALPFKSVQDCARIATHLRQLRRRARGGDVVIVGGGLEGIEALGEILRRRHDAVPLRVTLIESRKRLVADAPAALDQEIRRRAEPHGVHFETNARVARVDARRVTLEDGRRFPADLVIWTGGPAPAPLLAASDLAGPRAWAPVADTLESRDAPGVFVVGDAAALPDALSKQAYHALDMGAHAAANVERQLRGDAPEPFTPAPKPTLIAFGDLSCFLVWQDLVVAGSALAAGKEAVFELEMADLDRRAWGTRLTDASRRAGRALGSLLWPAVSGPRVLARNACVRVIAGVPALGLP